MSERADAVRMRDIARHFGSVQALRGADFSCARGALRTRAAVGAMILGVAA